MTIKQFTLPLVATTCLLLPQLALAHPGHDQGGGFLSGILHPISGIDHILAMVAVGLLAAQIGGRAVLLLPLTFVGLMIAGGFLAMGGARVPMVEQGIMASVLVLGLLIAAAAKLPTIAAMTLVGLFAIFHGYAHVAEMNASHSALAYASGFILATAMLHAVGLVTGIGLKRAFSVRASRIVGGAIAVCGVLLFVHVL